MFPHIGSPSSESPYSKGNLAVLLQFNATLIVGVLLFLTFSESLFIPDFSVPEIFLPTLSDPSTELLNLTFQLQQQINQMEKSIQKSKDLAQQEQLNLTLFIIFPFSLSSISILIIYMFEFRPEMKKGLVIGSIISTIIGIVFLVIALLWVYHTLLIFSELVG